MGQKVNPIGLRLGIGRKWDSMWFKEKGYGDDFLEDIEMRKFLFKHLNEEKDAGVSRIIIERFPRKINVNINTARPAMVIGKKGADIEILKGFIKKYTDKEVHINVIQIKNPDIDAKLISLNIAAQLKRRMPYRRAMKTSISNAMRSGAQGIRIKCSGRLVGAEMARTEQYKEGRIPLHTLRAEIDYGFSESFTTFGKIGVKVWVYKGEYTEQSDEKQPVRKTKKKTKESKK